MNTISVYDRILKYESKIYSIEQISDRRICSLLYNVVDEEGLHLLEAEKINSICEYYFKNNFLTLRQREFLNKIYVDNFGDI
jgi:hypothetical protein